MSSYGYLRVGSLVLSHLRNGVDNELLAVFRDDMLTVTPTTAHQYYSVDRGYSGRNEEYEDHEINILEFHAPGQMVAARLDMMGVNVDAAIAYLDEQFADDEQLAAEGLEVRIPNDVLDAIPADWKARTEREKALRESLDARGWLDQIVSAPEGSYWSLHPEPGTRAWLLRQLDEWTWSDLHVLRAALLALPEADVTLDITDLILSGYLPEEHLQHLASDAAMAIRAATEMYSPVVVLTEGRTDAEFLAAGLEILLPHLTDLIRFLDFEPRPEGGVAALVRMIRAFASAGVANRVVAVFDNDTAADDGLRVLNSALLPDRIQVVRYPRLELAENYPTLGPPTIEHPEGSLLLADVNGLAGSIELYLGKDVLMRGDGTLYPVQWKSYIAGMKRYQGEVVGKEAIHRAFRAKCELARRDSRSVSSQDWDGVRLILSSICTAAMVA